MERTISASRGLHGFSARLYNCGLTEPVAAGRMAKRGVKTLATPKQIQLILNSLDDVRGCSKCGTAIRFGDYDCPHCGADLEPDLRDWARRLVDAIAASVDSGSD